MTSRDLHQQPVRGSEPADLSAASGQLAADAEALAADHHLFSMLYDRNGLPPLWRREASFETLVRFILEQQVSLASANAAFGRLESRLSVVTPLGVRSSTDAEMKTDGFSRQKMGYVRGIADQIMSGELDPVALVGDADETTKRLLQIKGIGPWTASCFLLFVCGDRDVWPTGDRALYVSMARNMDMADVPDPEMGDGIASAWSPMRSTAARMLWHDYLGGRAYVPRSGAGFVGGTGKVLG
ncbi:MAG: DNA-3-methyladenine glycosylase 2 family protein [Actinobacteria bacterium]|nr:MAG: DNA-3-methyladenine glycosylase 2 family protein [Actinomycetota bacterium]